MAGRHAGPQPRSVSKSTSQPAPFFPMPLPTRDEARHLLEHHVADDYQRYLARMVATALEG